MIIKEKKKLSEIVKETETYFKSQSYSSGRIRVFRVGWKALDFFMQKNLIEYYDSMTGKMFIDSILKGTLYADLNKQNKDIIRSVNVLTEYLLTGTVKYRSILKKVETENNIGNYITKFLEYRTSNGFTVKTIEGNRRYLLRFLEFLNKNKVSKLSDIKSSHIIDYINSLGFYTKSTVHCMLTILRIFLKYLKEYHSAVDLSNLVPKSNYKAEAHLPTTYEKHEIENMMQAVDRGSPKGKRDIAMILLAVRLGLRASDICSLKFENILWKTNTINLIQHKTKKRIELPILDEIGNAIIDYLKYGRPVSDIPYVFLQMREPYSKISEPTLHSIVTLYLKRAGIENIHEKKHGPHALRHSLACFLLENKTPLPVIT